MVTAEHASKTSGEHEPTPKTTVIYAGSSARREDFIRWAFSGPKFAVSNRPGGDEDETRGVVAIMRQKIHAAYDTVSKEGLADPNGSLVVVAADIKTRIGTNPRSVSKLGTPEEARAVLTTMLENPNPWPYYTIEAGSGIKINKDKPVMTHDLIFILLNRKKIEQIATPDGFKAYRQNVQKYDTPPKGGKIDVTDVAGGLSLPALFAAGAILEIHHENGGNSLNPRLSLKKAIYHSGVGISPDLLRKVQPEIDVRLQSWPWLERTTARSMGELAA